MSTPLRSRTRTISSGSSENGRAAAGTSRIRPPNPSDICKEVCHRFSRKDTISLTHATVSIWQGLATSLLVKETTPSRHAPTCLVEKVGALASKLVSIFLAVSAFFELERAAMVARFYLLLPRHPHHLWAPQDAVL